MHESRRSFLAATFTLAVSAVAAAQRQMPTPMPGHSERPDSLQPPPFRFPKRDPKAELQSNQDRIKKDVNKLSQLVSDLKSGLDDSDTRQVLSIDVIRKAEEIEKLAKHIRELVRG